MYRKKTQCMWCKTYIDWVARWCHKWSIISPSLNLYLSLSHSLSPTLRCVANDMTRWEIFPSLLIGTTRRTSIYIYILLLATFWQHSVAWEKMHFTWFSRRAGFSPTRHQILPSPRRGSGQNTVRSWEKTPSPGKPCEMHIIAPSLLLPPNKLIKCFSCGQMGHTQAHCPKPDSTLPFKPPGWNSRMINYSGTFWKKKKKLRIDLKWRKMRSKVIFGHPKWARNAIESDFRSSKMAAGGHFKM